MMDDYSIGAILFLVFIAIIFFANFDFPKWSYEYKPIGDKEYFKFGTEYCINQSYEKLYEIRQFKRMYADITCMRLAKNSSIEMGEFTTWMD